MKSQCLNARHVHSFVFFVFVFFLKIPFQASGIFAWSFCHPVTFKIKKGMLFSSSSHRLLKTLHEGYVQSVGKLHPALGLIFVTPKWEGQRKDL